jgi:hypothetical protein
MTYSDGFYKVNNTSLLFAKNSILGPSISLSRTDKDTYEYPIDGWYWFDTLEDAVSFFNLNIEDYTEQEQQPELPTFIPPPVTSLTVTAYQAKMALEAAGLYDTVDAYVRSSNNNQLIIAWDNATVFERNSPFIESFGPELGLSEEQIDTLFTEASKVV